jgi:hypothetical protein
MLRKNARRLPGLLWGLLLLALAALSAAGAQGASAAGPWLLDDAEFVRGLPTVTPRPTRAPTPAATPQSARTPAPPRAAQLYTPLQRFGLAFSPGYGALADYPLQQLPFGWYADWAVRERPQLAGRYEFAQTIRVSPDHYPPHWEGLQRAILANPGSLWIIGNEPECIHQDRRTPEEYAEIYHTLYTYIKRHDPTAQIAIGGVVQPTPLRLQWLDRVLAHYRAAYGRAMPVDVWNIHVQILQEKRGEYGADIPVGIAADEGRLYPWWENDSIEHFKQLVWEMRRWMAARGYQNKPLIISEFGVLMPTTHFDALDGPGAGQARVMAFMSASLDFLLTAKDAEIGHPADGGRLVQRWLWFSLNHPSWEQLPGGMSGFNGGLADPFTQQLTTYGRHYAAYMRTLFGAGR